VNQERPYCKVCEAVSIWSDFSGLCAPLDRSIILPAYVDYVKRSKENKEKNDKEVCGLHSIFFLGNIIHGYWKKPFAIVLS
jgi:hypothetical protein